MLPLKFSTILKSTVWGGERIIPFKHLNDQTQCVGESWEISGLADDESHITNGAYQGWPLSKLIEEQKGKLIGEHVYKRFGNRFPLLIKFIDANSDLSIQVHPDDETSRKMGYENGKTEMWYVIGTTPEAYLLYGFKEPLTPEAYKQAVDDSTIGEKLCRYSIHEGDCFFIPAGQVHAIGTGAMVIEIQQTSDVTFRIFDYNRKDADGNLRELHTEQALQAIHFNDKAAPMKPYQVGKKEETLVTCPYFVTKRHEFNEEKAFDYSSLDSFVILIAYEGEGILTNEEGEQVSFRSGESLLIPASTQKMTVTTIGCKFLEVTLPQ